MRSFIDISESVKKLNFDGAKQDVIAITPNFISAGKDYMTKGGNFYAMLNPKTNLWETDESEALQLIDEKLYSHRDKIAVQAENGFYYTKKGAPVIVECLDSSLTNQLYAYRKWMRSLPPNHNYRQLDSNITFIDEEVTPDMYRSKRLKYEVKQGDITNYDKLIGTLYSEENKRKIEWVIGSIFTGDSKKIEKLMVLYGDKGTGKSTVIDLIKDLFEGYYGVFVAADLANKSNQFSTEFLKNNPLVSIQDDGSLSKIDSPLINEIVSHKEIIINEKNTKHYSMKMDTFLILATNEKVDIHDTKMGITRRLLDVYPTGIKFPVKEYRQYVHNMSFELGAIAYHCIQVYKELGKEYYLNYIPEAMIDKTNYIRNFIFDNFDKFIANKYFTRDVMYKWYKEYCDESGIPYIQKRIDFGEQMIEYFEEYYKIKHIDGGTKRHVYLRFKDRMFLNEEDMVLPKKEKFETPDWLKMRSRTYGTLDVLYPDVPAQYASEDGKPLSKWKDVTTTLKEIKTNKLHFVKVPENLIVIDFDIKNENGEKDPLKNLEAASRWPATYAELSKSGAGIHLHYIYNGDVSKLKMLYDKDIEIKVFKGNSSLRRMVTKCNNEEIAVISSGLPEKEEKMINEQSIKDERHLRALIAKALRKEIFPNTKPCMDFILKVTDDAYNSGIHYDITDMRPDIQVFANNSTHQAGICLNIINKIHWMSDEPSEDPLAYRDDTIIFFDVEVFPNLFVVCWKEQGEGKTVVKMINPTPADIEELTKFKLVGFNNRNYDNHILYAAIMGYNLYQLYDLSQRIISEQGRNAKFGEAYKLSFTDIYDYASKKQSLKKWEIELGIHHQELGLRWDESVPKDKWELVAEYCCNDVIATEAVWDATQGDFLAREILADLSGLTVNDTTNQCTTRIIVGNDKNPQDDFVYTDLSTIFPGYEYASTGIDKLRYNEGTKIVSGKSLYLGEDPGEGGYVYAEPGIYRNVGLLDVASMHPHSAIRLNIFGSYTKNFEDIVNARIHIKRGEFEEAGKMLDGKLKPYLTDKSKAKALSQALKIAINSVYGLTSAKFENKLRDPRNKDNIVAKYGALFMINLKHEVQSRGYTVVHIKTDSIKIANMDDKIKDFCMEYAKDYGYEFEHEATYEKLCLVNESTYICKDMSDGHWSATGAQFQIPYVFKTLFSHEPITFDDMCETKSVTTALYLDMNEGLGENEHNYKFVGKVGQFSPIKDGCNGGILVREATDKDGNIKYNAATGTKKPDGKSVYRWLESEDVRNLKMFDDVDTSYFNHLVEDAVDTINKFGSYEDFVSDNSWINVPEGLPDEVPFPMNPPVV